MAIYHFHAQIIKRSEGRSTVPAAAYRAGEKLHNERDGTTHDYTKKSGVVHSEIMLPENAPIEYSNRAVLWNAVEKSLKRKDAQPAREINVALPVEFNMQEQIDIMRKYIQDNFVSNGMCADFAIHDMGDGNPHAHIMLTKNDVSKSGFGRKNDDWDKKEAFLEWRKNWADMCNSRLPQEKHIDHRTLEAQGIDREPAIHVGVVAKQIERMGRESDRGTINREIKKRNDGISTTREATEKMKKYATYLAKANDVDLPEFSDFWETHKFIDKIVHPERHAKKESTILSQHADISPEIISEYMKELKQAYHGINEEIHKIRMENAGRQEQRAARIHELQSRVERMDEDRLNIFALNGRLSELKAEREQMGFFKSKREIDGLIKRIEKSKQQAVKTFRRERGFDFDDEERYQRALSEIHELKLKSSTQTGYSSLLEKREEIAEMYKREKVFLELHPKAESIKRFLEESKEHDTPKDPRAITREVRAEQNLNRISKKDLYAITKKHASPDEQEKLMKIFSRAKNREPARWRMRHDK